MRQQLHLWNEFHATQATLKVRVDREGRGYFTRRQIRRAKAKLCPEPDTCTCSDMLGARPSFGDRLVLTPSGEGWVSQAHAFDAPALCM